MRKIKKILKKKFIKIKILIIRGVVYEGDKYGRTNEEV